MLKEHLLFWCPYDLMHNILNTKFVKAGGEDYYTFSST